MDIIVATAIGKSRDGRYFDLFPSRWSAMAAYHTNTFYPYDLAYLSSMLKRDTHARVKLIDGNYQGYTIGKYVEVLTAERPDLLVLEADSLTYGEDMEMIRTLKARIPVKALLCGPYPTYAPAQALRDGADFVALGEFQGAIVDFVRRSLDPATPGLWPNGRSALLDVNSLPLPEDDDISRRDYCRLYACEYREIEVFPTRGCPVSCNYCVARNVYYGVPNFRPRDPQNVVAELQTLLRRYPELEGFFFDEESHTASRDYIRRLCRALIDAGLNHYRYECMTNYATLDREVLEQMKRAGYYKVRIGVETLDIPNAEQIFSGRWKRNVAKLMEVMHDCRELGIKVYGTFSVGTLGATAETDRATLRSLRLLCEEGLMQDFQVSINTPMPGTPFYEQVKAAGYLVTDDPALQNGNCTCVVSFPGYPREEIEEVFAEFTAFRVACMQANRERGVHYSMYDE